MQTIYWVIALLLGLAIANVDTRPNWDDTGIIAAAILVSCGVLGALGPRQPWLTALAVGIWVPFFGIALSQNYGSLLALVVAFAGAYAGMALRRIGWHA